MSGPSDTVEARALTAGQWVYLKHLDGWFELSADARPHRTSANVTVLEFLLIPDEYRPASTLMPVANHPHLVSASPRGNH